VRNASKNVANARKSRVGDKIKRRMSMRYADISEPMAIPNVPQLPQQYLRPIAEAQGIIIEDVEEDEDLLLVSRTDGYDDGGISSYGGFGVSGAARRIAKKPVVVLDAEALQQADFDPNSCQWCNQAWNESRLEKLSLRHQGNDPQYLRNRD
jgi:hypothetical protein